MTVTRKNGEDSVGFSGEEVRVSLERQSLVLVFDHRNSGPFQPSVLTVRRRVDITVVIRLVVVCTLHRSTFYKYFWSPPVLRSCLPGRTLLAVPSDFNPPLHNVFFSSQIVWRALFLNIGRRECLQFDENRGHSG